jgi:hypothetical protein
MHVYAADWLELSLLTLGAFPAARVSTVTANRGEAMSDEPVEPELEEDDPDDGEEEQPVEELATLPVNAARGHPRVVPLRTGPAAQPRRADLRAAAELISTNLRRGRSGTVIQAALADLTTNDAAGVVRPSYRSEIVGLIDHGMPLVNALEQRPLPESGMLIEYPVWTTLPAYTAIQSRGLNNTTGVPPAPGEKTAIASGESAIGVESDEIEVWAQGADISIQLAERSSPNFIDEWLRAAAVDAGNKYDAYVANRLLTAAAAGTAGASFVENVKALFAVLAGKKVPPGPLFLALSYDVWLDTVDVTGLEGPAFWDMSISFGSYLPDASTGGLYAFVDPNLPPGTMLLGSRQGAANYGGPATTANLRVVDVSLLGYNVGVYFYATPAVLYPEAFAKLSGLSTLGAESESSSRSSRKS